MHSLAQGLTLALLLSQPRCGKEARLLYEARRGFGAFFAGLEIFWVWGLWVIVRLSSLLFIVTDRWGAQKNSAPSCVSNGAVLLPTVRKPTGCLLEFFSENNRKWHQLFIGVCCFFPAYFTVVGRFHYFEEVRQQWGDVKIQKTKQNPKQNRKKSTDVGFNLVLSMMIQQADIWCSRLDLKFIFQLFFYFLLQHWIWQGKSRYRFNMLRSGSFQYSVSISALLLFSLQISLYLFLFTKDGCAGSVNGCPNGDEPKARATLFLSRCTDEAGQDHMDLPKE